MVGSPEVSATVVSAPSVGSDPAQVDNGDPVTLLSAQVLDLAGPAVGLYDAASDQLLVIVPTGLPLAFPAPLSFPNGLALKALSGLSAVEVSLLKT